MPRFSFSTFVKLGLLSSPQQSEQLEKYGEPGSGYDFYKRLKKGAKAYAGTGMGFDESIAPILSSNESPEKTHNLAAMNSLKGWVEKKKPELLQPPDYKIYQAPKKKFEVRVEPEFAMVFEDMMWVVQVFASSELRLTPKSAEPGLHLLRQRYQGTEFANANPGILDLGSGKLLAKKWNTNRAAKNFEHLVNDISSRIE